MYGDEERETLNGRGKVGEENGKIPNDTVVIFI